MSRVLRLGTRRSALATTQSGWVADQLAADVELVEITTEGDTNMAPLATIGGTGVFVAALRQALLEGSVDIAVHSLKDLPVAPADGLTIAAIPVREDPRDAVVARDGLLLSQLPAGSVVGTGSPRRAAQIHALGLGLQVRAVRGNVDTRIALVTSGELDAVVLARAGLARLGRLDEATEILEPVQMLPAPGQGALAVECRTDDAQTVALVQALDDADTRAAVTAERALLGALEAGCSAPVGALAEISEELDGSLEISLRGFVGDPDPEAPDALELRRSAVGRFEAPQDLGRELAEVFLADGALEALSPPPRPPAGSGSSPESSTEESSNSYALEREK
ncbi:hydroxymethylbilane synthase [Dermacoccaceae bacterium W4C1]